MDNWLVLDVSFLAYRAFHTLKDLSFEGVGTGVLFGIFRDIVSLSDFHGTDKLAFCFDRGKPLRKFRYPDYKEGRRSKEPDPEEIAARRELKRQIRALHNEYLHEAGFRNIFSKAGYEADDLIASICENKADHESITIISCDSDLYQLLAQDVSIWNPAKKVMVTEASFKEEYGIGPSQWATVKAVAGCPTDNVKGVVGVGEKTAIKYLCGELKPGTMKFTKIVVSSDLISRNLPIVELPYEGTPNIRLKGCNLNRKKLRKLAERLGMSSLRI